MEKEMFVPTHFILNHLYYVSFITFKAAPSSYRCSTIFPKNRSLSASFHSIIQKQILYFFLEQTNILLDAHEWENKLYEILHATWLFSYNSEDIKVQNICRCTLSAVGTIPYKNRKNNIPVLEDGAETLSVNISLCM